MMILVAALGVPLALFCKKVRDARDAAVVSQCCSNLNHITLALHLYHEAYGSLPPAYVADVRGRPMHSWRVLILPFMPDGCRQVYDAYNFDEPWDGPNNRKLADQMPSIYACPEHRGDFRDFRSRSVIWTSYVAVVGPGTAFPGARPISRADVHDEPPTILLTEVAAIDIPWMEPRDLDATRMSFLINDPSRPGISSTHRDGACASTVDGRFGYIRLREFLSPETVRALITIDGGELIGRNHRGDPLGVRGILPRSGSAGR